MDTPVIEKNDADIQEKTETFADKVTKIVNEAEVDDKGNLILPDDMSEEVKFAAVTEKRRRDTQSSFTKLSKSHKALEVEKATLIKNFTKADVKLTPEQTEELENLKFEDPDAWRVKLNQYEEEARNKRIKEIDDELKQVSKSTLDNEELEDRKTILANFKENNDGFELNQTIIDNDIPPRITKKLETGAITFLDFLNECRDYLSKGKVIGQGDEPNKQPNLGKVGGASKPEDSATAKDIVTSYDKETF